MTQETSLSSVTSCIVFSAAGGGTYTGLSRVLISPFRSLVPHAPSLTLVARRDAWHAATTPITRMLICFLDRAARLRFRHFKSLNRPREKCCLSCRPFCVGSIHFDFKTCLNNSQQKQHPFFDHVSYEIGCAPNGINLIGSIVQIQIRPAV